MARQPMARPDSAETPLIHDPPASADVKPGRQNQSSHHSPASKNGAGQSASSASVDEVLQLVAQQACLATSASACAIALAEGGQIVCRATAGSHTPEIGARLDTGSGLTGACVRSGKLQYCEDTDYDSRVNPEACRRLQVRSVLVVPLLHQDELLGIIEIFSPFPQAFARHDLQNLDSLSQVILDHLTNARHAGSATQPLQSGVFEGDEPFFASASDPALAAPWDKAPAVPAESSAAPLELSAIRWEPAEAQPTFLEAPPEENYRPQPQIREQKREDEDERGNKEHFSSPPITPPAPPVNQVPIAPAAPVAPPVAAQRLPLVEIPLEEFPPSSAKAEWPPESDEAEPFSPAMVMPRRPRRRDWTTSFLTLTVIAVALLLGWMLGHAGWQRVIGPGKGSSSLSLNKSGSSPSQAEAATPAEDTGDAVFPAAGKSDPGASRPRTPFQPKAAGPAQSDGGLVVYEHGKIIFQQKAKPESSASRSDGSRSAAADSDLPGDAVQLSPETASSYLIRRVEPVYPEDARLQNIEGEVRLEALVGKDGTVQVLRLVSGDSQLAQAAADAVRQWRFRPYKSAGKPAPFSTNLTVSFRLQ